METAAHPRLPQTATGFHSELDRGTLQRALGETADSISTSPAWVAFRRAMATPIVQVLACVIGLCAALSCLVIALDIPPLVESDYCYLHLAADRWIQGQGFTSLQPVAPFQPWEWRYEWGFLTQWPVGYPALLVGLHGLLGLAPLAGARVVAVVAAAAGFVGWVRLFRRTVPCGGTSWLLAVVAAFSGVRPEWLVNPSTDALLAAAIPYLLRAAAPRCDGRESATSAPVFAPGGFASISLSRWAMIGVVCGLLFWIRYASLFVPAGLGAFLLLRAWRRRRGWMVPIVFGLAAMVPIAVLVVMNRALGQSASTQQALNLGVATGGGFRWEYIATAWRTFTDMGYFNHRPEAAWLLSVGPLMLAAMTFIVRPWRMRAVRFLRLEIVGASMAVLVSLLAMLVVGTSVFGAKFDYVALPRYYAPVQPVYFLLFVAPIALILSQWRPGTGIHAVLRLASRCALVVALLSVAIWSVQVDWHRPLRRWSAASFEAMLSGARANCFLPGAVPLVEWLRRQKTGDLVVVSNFHEFLALETGLATVPIPPDRAALDRWVERISTARGITNHRVLFVLDRDNRWRNHWIAPFGEVTTRFGLSKRLNIEGVSAELFEYDARPSSARCPAQTVNGAELSPGDCSSAMSADVVEVEPVG